MDWQHIVAAGLWAHAFCSGVAMFLPPVRNIDPRWYAVVYAVVNAVALNHGYARNDPRKDG